MYFNRRIKGGYGRSRPIGHDNTWHSNTGFGGLMHPQQDSSPSQLDNNINSYLTSSNAMEGSGYSGDPNDGDNWGNYGHTMRRMGMQRQKNPRAFSGYYRHRYGNAHSKFGGPRKSGVNDVKKRKSSEKVNDKSKKRQNEWEIIIQEKEADKNTSYVGVPSSVLYCHVCFRHIKDPELFEKHVQGKNHRLQLTELNERHRKRVDLLRQQIKDIEKTRDIDLERVQIEMHKLNRINNSSENNHNACEPLLRNYCNMCEVQYYGLQIEHSDRHQKLKQFLHPKCELCNISFHDHLEIDKHNLTVGHLMKIVKRRSINHPNVKDKCDPIDTIIIEDEPDIVEIIDDEVAPVDDSSAKEDNNYTAVNVNLEHQEANTNEEPGTKRIKWGPKKQPEIYDINTDEDGSTKITSVGTSVEKPDEVQTAPSQVWTTSIKCPGGGKKCAVTFSIWFDKDTSASSTTAETLVEEMSPAQTAATTSTRVHSGIKRCEVAFNMFNDEDTLTNIAAETLGEEMLPTLVLSTSSQERRGEKSHEVTLNFWPPEKVSTNTTGESLVGNATHECRGGKRSEDMSTSTIGQSSVEEMSQAEDESQKPIVNNSIGGEKREVILNFRPDKDKSASTIGQSSDEKMSTEDESPRPANVNNSISSGRDGKKREVTLNLSPDENLSTCTIGQSSVEEMSAEVESPRPIVNTSTGVGRSGKRREDKSSNTVRQSLVEEMSAEVEPSKRIVNVPSCSCCRDEKSHKGTSTITAEESLVGRMSFEVQSRRRSTSTRGRKGRSTIVRRGAKRLTIPI